MKLFNTASVPWGLKYDLLGVGLGFPAYRKVFLSYMFEGESSVSLLTLSPLRFVEG